MKYSYIENFIKDDGFECNVDLPVIQYVANAKIENDDNDYKVIKHTLHYDYLLDSFFVSHPYRLSLAQNSYITEDCYERAKNDSIDLAENVFENLVKRTGVKSVKEIVIEKAYPYITSYKFEGKFENNKIKFRFPDELLIGLNKYNRGIYKFTRRIGIKIGIQECYNRELFELALKTMAKFKFSYKSNTFENPKIVNTTLLDGDEILLPKFYYLLSAEGKLDDSYLPSMIKFENDLFDEPIELPVLIKRKK